MEELKTEVIATNLQIANTLVEAKLKNSTLQQLKIMLMIADRVQNTRELKAEKIDLLKIYPIRFKQRDFVKELGLTEFKDCLKSILELQKQQISYKRTDEEGTWTGYVNFFYKTEFLEDKDLRLFISGEVLVFLSLLHQKGYTKIIKELAMNLNSKYSFRMYEICSKISQQTTKKREYELNEFYELLGIPKKLRNTNALKHKVLDSTKKELEEKTNISFEYQFSTKKYTNKTGRPAYTHIEISI